MAGFEAGQLVLVRSVYRPTRDGHRLSALAPLLWIREDDGAKLNGESIITVKDSTAIRHLPIVKIDRERDGVLGGIGYEPGLWSLFEKFGGHTPIYVDYAGSKVGTVIPEAIIKKHDGARGFYVCEIPLSGEERLRVNTARVDNTLQTTDRIIGDTNEDWVRGYNEWGPLEGSFIRILGAIKPSREIGRDGEVMERRNTLRGLISRATARGRLRALDDEGIAKVYEDPVLLAQLVAERRSMLERYRATLTEPYEVAAVSDRILTLEKFPESRTPEILSVYFSAFGPFCNDIVLAAAQNEKLSAYKQALDNAFGIAGGRVETLHPWQGRFSIFDVQDTAREVIDYARYLEIVRASFGSNVEDLWEGIVKSISGNPAIAVRSRLARPYIQELARKTR